MRSMKIQNWSEIVSSRCIEWWYRAERQRLEGINGHFHEVDPEIGGSPPEVFIRLTARDELDVASMCFQKLRKRDTPRDYILYARRVTYSGVDRAFARARVKEGKKETRIPRIRMHICIRGGHSAALCATPKAIYRCLATNKRITQRGLLP